MSTVSSTGIVGGGESVGFGSWSDLPSREQRIRDNEVLLSSYATRVSQNLQTRAGVHSLRNTLPSALSPGNLRPSLQSVFGTPLSPGGLIDPQSDPLLSLGSDTTAGTDASQELFTNPQTIAPNPQSTHPMSSAFAPRFLAPPIRGLSIPSRVRRAEIALDSMISQPTSTWMLGSGIQPLNVSSNDQATELDNIQNVTVDDITLPLVPGAGTEQSLLLDSSLSTSVTQAPVSDIFSTYLQSQSSSATVTTTTTAMRSSVKPFQSIRERLKSNMPLSSVNVTATSTTASNSVCAPTAEIPKVTVIMSSGTQSNSALSDPKQKSRNPTKKQSATSSRVGVIPKVRIMLPDGQTNVSDLYTSSNATRSTQRSVSTCTASQTTSLSNTSANDSCVTLEDNLDSNQTRSRLTDSDTNLDSAMPSHLPVISGSCPNSTVSGLSSSASLIPDNSANSASNGLLLEGAESEPATSATSFSTLFNNIVQQRSEVSDSVLTTRSYQTSAPQQTESTLPSQLQNLHNMTRYMTIMGPYLESRGVNPVTTVTNPMLLFNRTQNVPIVPIESATQFTSTNLQHSRDQASSDTENELTSHLNPSGAYFLPITEDQRRSLSSASLNRNTDSAALRQIRLSAESSDSVQGQSSRSSSQNQDIELVVDQNENYTTNRPSGSHGDTQNITMRNHDSNNNSIHIVTSSREPNREFPTNTVPSNVEDRDQDYLRLRNSFVSMTDQIEREMNELNRRINALRDSFSQSIRSLRQDRRRYESMDSLLQGETATNIGSSDLSVHQPQDTAGRLSNYDYTDFF